jgi:ATP-dependent Clp protease ATP-binding subunit ClpC
LQPTPLPRRDHSVAAAPRYGICGLSNNMKPNYSNSLLLAWQVAEFEARRLNAAFIEPAHFLLGLCKCVDIDFPSSIPSTIADRDKLLEELLREFQRLRKVFRTAGLDPARFRRHYRTLLPEGSPGLNPESARLHRTGSSRDVFANAEMTAEISGSAVYPIHLLHALLNESDALMDKAIAALGTNGKRLLEAVEADLFGQQRHSSPPRDSDRIKWN